MPATGKAPAKSAAFTDTSTATPSGAEKQYEVVCPGGVLARAGFAMNSPKAGTLQPGEIIQALEIKLNPNGIERIRFKDRLTGWASTKAGDGTVLLQEVGGDKDASDDDDDSSDEEDVSSSEGDSGSSSSDGGGDTAANYRAVVNGLVREGFQMNTKKTGTLKKGSEINALETRVNDQGVTRVRFDNGQLAGWASTRAGDGSTLLEKIGENDAESNGAPGRKIWCESTCCTAPDLGILPADAFLHIFLSPRSGMPVATTNWR